MRAYSSLIGHILGSHAQINGYFEMHLSYDQAASLDQQLGQYLESEQIKPHSHYMFDKLLHNDYTLDTKLFGDNLPRIIVTLRPPLQTIKSIVNLFRNKAEPHPYAEVDQAVQYYIQRLQWLDQFCHDDSLPFFYFDADIIRHQPQQLLSKLGNWLQLETPLSEHYEIFSRTGQAGAGDSSAQIQKGSIQQNHNSYESIEVPLALLREAELIYHSVRKNLMRLAQQSIV
jgi:hypothetical protein